MASNGKRIHQRMSRSKYQKLHDYMDTLVDKTKNMTRNKRRPILQRYNMIEELATKSMYDSAGGERTIPYERQREQQMKTERQPKGPAVDKEEAYLRMQEKRGYPRKYFGIGGDKK